MTEIETQAFEQAVERWILDAIVSGIDTFSQLIDALPSVDPVIAFDTLKRLNAHARLSQRTFAQLLAPTRRKQTRFDSSRYQIGLPLPHPLDFDWRFTDISVNDLLQQVEKMTAFDDTIVLLGTPSLFRGARTMSHRRMILLEANRTMTNCLISTASCTQVTCCDLLKDAAVTLSAGAVVLDPPWYPEHIHAFLWNACQVCSLGGHILVSLPPIGTRPSIDREWSDLLIWANQLGLELVDREKLSLSYLTPAFERNAFRVAGVPPVRRDWRRGDLAIFCRVRLTQVQRPTVAIQDVWEEINLLGIRIRVRPWTDSEFSDSKLVPILPGDVLTSVSRRDSRRGLADVWTSGNRIFRCQGRSILFQVLQAISTGSQTHDVVEAFLKRSLHSSEAEVISETTRQILSLINTEQKENLLFEDYWNNTNFSLAAS